MRNLLIMSLTLYQQAILAPSLDVLAKQKPRGQVTQMTKKSVKGRWSPIPVAVSLGAASDVVLPMVCRNWDTPVVAVSLGVFGLAEEIDSKN